MMLMVFVFDIVVFGMSLLFFEFVVIVWEDG